MTPQASAGTGARRAPRFPLRVTSTTLVAALITAYCALAAIYAFTTPAFETPDEPYHFGMAQYIARTGELPVQDAGKPNTPYFQEGSQPPLYYMVAAAVLRLMPDALPPFTPASNPHAAVGVGLATNNQNVYIAGQPAPIDRAVHVLRLLSIACGAVTVWAVYRAARAVFTGTARPLLAAAFVALNPMFLFIHGSINNDTLLATLAALLTWRMLKRLNAPERRRAGATVDSLLDAVLAAAAILTKVSGFGMIALLAGLLVMLWLKRTLSLRQALIEAGLTVLVIASLAGWWYLRNVQLYGELTGTTMMIAIIGPRTTVPTWVDLLGELQGLRISAWALFGWLNVIGPTWFFGFMDTWTVIALIGGVLSVGAAIRRRDWVAIRPLGLLAAEYSLYFVALILWTRLTPGTQARLLFPALTAIAILTIYGWTAIIRTLMRPLGQWGSGVIAPAPLAVMLIVAVASPSLVIAPAYALPSQVRDPQFSDHTDATLLYARFGTIEMIGYRLEVDAGSPVRIAPGGELALTFYLRATQPIEKRLSLFVTIYDCDHQVIGKLDTYPGGGKLPTDRWVVGTVYEDRYRIRIGSFTTDLCQPLIETGWYNFADRTYLPEDHTGKLSLTFRAGLLVIAEHVPATPLTQQPATFSSAIRLLGYSLPAAQVRAGETLTVDLVLEGLAAMQENFTVLVHLETPDQRVIYPADGPPRKGDYPTSAWIPGVRFTDRHPIAVPLNAPPGQYRIAVGFYRPGDLSRLPVDGSSADYVILSAPIAVLPPADKPASNSPAIATDPVQP